MEKQIADTVRSMGIFVGSTAFMVAAFGIAGAVYGPVGEVGGDLVNIIRYGQLALAVMAAVQASVMNRAVTAKLDLAETMEAKLATYKARTIIVVASVEAAALFAGIAVLLTGLQALMLPAFVLFGVVVAMTFPTQARVRKALSDATPAGKDRYA